jgi:hypothetical protein
MSKDKKSTAEKKSIGARQINMDVDGCSVKLNFIPQSKETARIETVKRMILSGLSKG